MRLIGYSMMLTLCLSTQVDAATEPLRSADAAFPVQIQSVQQDQAELSWQVPKHYYLYQHSIVLKATQQHVPLTMPKAKPLYDENYGQTLIYDHDVKVQFSTEKNQRYQLTWQGCAKDQICYPPQSIEFTTDHFGLVQQTPTRKNSIDLSSPSAIKSTSAFDLQQTPALPEPVQNTTAQDQQWSEKLAQHSFFYGILLFLGLGILLAFTPCSLPMLPILTSLIVRQHTGLKAWMISLSFVLSMASVYAVLGLIASSAGLGFQRWLQQPSTLIAFSILFVVFACNLLGWFEIRLPQRLVNRLDQLQGAQKGGTLLGAAMMGLISALLVGPCMTAPLAGVLLFISQTQHQWQGAVLLFSLGLGMGIPLLLASILGAHVLPKAGLWMNQIRVLFALMMLGLAIYFVRPLLPYTVFWLLSTGLMVGAVLYATVRILKMGARYRIIYIAALALSLSSLAYVQYQAYQQYQRHDQVSHLDWHVVRNSTELNQVLAQVAQQRPVVIDVYADWCIACQPIEHKILKSERVQHALAPYVLIKLDLSHYDQSHQALLNQWEILGPPTYLFLDAQQQERRDLRLTGAFTEEALLQQLQQLHIN